MNDPVLHRKLFREKALRVGALKPRRYQVGAGPMGVAPITPEGPTYNPYTTKTVDGKVYSLDRMGNVVKVDYLPATINQPQGGMSKLFQGLEAIVDPASASERGTYRKIGQTIFNPKTYTEGIPALVKGAGRIAKSIPGYAVVEEGIDRIIPDTGNALADIGINIGALGASEYAKTATGKAFQGAGIKNLLGRGALRAVATPAVLAGVLNPYVAGAAAIAAPVVGAKMLHDYRMANNPEYAALIEKEKELQKNEPTLDPDTSMMMYGTPQKLNLKDVTPQDGGTGAGGTPPGGTPPAGSDFSNMGGVSQPLVTPAGTIAPLGDFENKVAETVEKTVNGSGTKKLDSTKKETTQLSFFDKMGDFARSASGNAFLLKFAAGLLSGKGTFGEVVGNALNPAVDLFAAYKLKEDEIANKQFTELMKLKAKNEGKDLDKDIGNFPVFNKDGTQSFITAYRNKKTQQVETHTRNARGEVVITPVPSDQASLFNQKSDEFKPALEEAITSYGSIATGLGLLEYVKKVNDSNLGASGATKDLFNTLKGIGSGVATSFTTQEPKFTDAAGNDLTGKALKEAQKKWEGLDKVSKSIFNDLDKDTVKELGKLKVTETTLKYYLANAFKDKDRLTNTDLQLVADLTDIITFRKGTDQVRANLDALQSVLQDKQTQLRKKINKFGVTDTDFASSFYNTSGAVVATGFGVALGQPTGGKIDFSKLTPGERENALKRIGF
jgi:hypothetical protein